MPYITGITCAFGTLCYFTRSNFPEFILLTNGVMHGLGYKDLTIPPQLSFLPGHQAPSLLLLVRSW